MAWDSIDGMRDLLRSSLGRSLRTLSPLDRLLAAWPVACGTALATHGEILRLEDGIATVLVPDPVWRRQLLSMRSELLADLRRIASVDLREIHFAESAVSGNPAQPSPTRSFPRSRPPRNPGPSRRKPAGPSRRSPPV